MEFDFQDDISLWVGEYNMVVFKDETEYIIGNRNYIYDIYQDKDLNSWEAEDDPERANYLLQFPEYHLLEKLFPINLEQIEDIYDKCPNYSIIQGW